MLSPFAIDYRSTPFEAIVVTFGNFPYLVDITQYRVPILLFVSHVFGERQLWLDTLIIRALAANDIFEHNKGTRFRFICMYACQISSLCVDACFESFALKCVHTSAPFPNSKPIAVNGVRHDSILLTARSTHYIRTIELSS